MARAGCDLTFVDRWEEHVSAINLHGFHVEGSRGVHRIRARAITPDRLGEVAPLETVIVAVKSQDTRRALVQLLPYSTPQTCFVSMQAGMNLPTFEQVVGGERTIGADPNYGGVVVGPGRLEAGFPNYIVVGELDGTFTDRLRVLQRDFTYWTPTHMTANIRGAVWSKFVYGSEIQCAAITDRARGDALGPPRHRLVAAAAVQEAMRVADALAIELMPFDFFDPEVYRSFDGRNVENQSFWARHAWPRHEIFRKYGTHAFANTGSIWRWDIVHQHRDSEAASYFDALRAAAKQVGLDVPINAAVVRIIREIEAGVRTMNDENFEELFEIVKAHAGT